MPSLLKHTECPACGHRHHFCLITGDLVTGRTYAYVCPETAKKAMLRPTSAAEVVQSPPQGAVVLSPAVYDLPPDSRTESPGSWAGKSLPRGSPETGRGQPLAAGSLTEETRDRVSPSVAAANAASGMPGIEREVHQIGREIQGLAARVGELEEKVTGAPPAATAPPASLPAGANQPEAGPTRLQEVLPEVKELAGKVGGLEQLSDIVQTLKEAKKK
jgi:hypothetical protein